MIDNSPFSMFMVHTLWSNKYFLLNNIHVFFIILFCCVLLLGLIFRYSKSNIIHNFLFNIWDMVNNLLNTDDDNGDTNRHSWIFFSLFLLILMTNILTRLPGFVPAASLLIVSIPLHLIILIYFLYHSFLINGKHILHVFFNPHILLPIRIFIGIMEVISFFAKAFSFSIRLLANVTAGHILMWVIEKFIMDMPLYLKPVPFIFLIGMYMMEFAVALLQSYIFLLLSTGIFKSISNPSH